MTNDFDSSANRNNRICDQLHGVAKRNSRTYPSKFLLVIAYIFFLISKTHNFPSSYAKLKRKSDQ